MPPKRSVAAWRRRLGVVAAGCVELDDEQVARVADGLGDNLGVAAGSDDTKMERGNLSGVSEGVLEALALGLQLDEAEHAHLFDLARAAGPVSRPRRRSAAQRVRPSVQRI